MMPVKNPVLFTIGQSTHSPSRFIELLNMNEIQALVDVRTSPYSKYNPQFNKDTLQALLKSNGIYYVFLGKYLGARRDEDECYINNKVVYSEVAKTKAFKDGLMRLYEGANKMRIAIMCAEKDPLTCHRTILVAHYAQHYFKEVNHILEEG